MREGDLDSFEINTLASFEPQVGCSILLDFKTDVVNKDVSNKSGFLAGVMRRYSKVIKKSESTSGNAKSRSTQSLAGAEEEESEAPHSKDIKVHALLMGYDDDDADVVTEEVI